MTKIEEIEQRLNELKANFNAEFYDLRNELAELKESKKEGKWKPKEGEEYYYKDVEGDICSDNWNNHICDKLRYDNTLLFPTKEECERYWHFMDTLKEKSYEFSNLDWRDDDIVKWVIEYDYVSKQLRVGDHRYIKHFGLIYFKDKESAQFIIDNFGEELEKYWL